MRIYEDATNVAFWNCIDDSAQTYLGAHKQKGGWVFRVWAPNANAVSVVGDFCGWDTNAYRMTRVENGIWECFIPGLKQYDAYKYAIHTKSGNIIFKADPYANHFETRPATASKLYDIGGFKWGDGAWLKKRASADRFNTPMNIYEMHLGSWITNADGSISYKQLADSLCDYVSEMGYTHVELMPVTEYPYDKSWGYQVTGYFAPTSRYGTPHDFMYLVNKLHKNGIGVILDWVPAHFPKDEMGLYEFDGSCLYEYYDPIKREHTEWGTRIFDYGKREVASFLISSACHWLDAYHIDGIRVDAVASMLYLDYAREDGQWQPNIYGGNGNLEAIEFLKLFNTLVHKDRAGVFTVAEESTSWPLITAPVDAGGLGFDFKWNMGWMNDTLRYMSQPYENRWGIQNLISFSTSYAFSENFILPLSHDEVVHGKCSLIGKMPGFYDDKFANLRAYLGYMFTHPGKKLTFMGSEFAQFIEWDESKQLDWMLLDYPNHKQFKDYVKDLNHFYKTEKCLYERDTDYSGFSWISADDSTNNVYAYRRLDSEGRELVVILNFSAYHHQTYYLGVSQPGKYTLAFSSDMQKYGGFERAYQSVSANKQAMHGLDYSAEFSLPPFSVTIYKKRKSSPKKQKN